MKFLLIQPPIEDFYLTEVRTYPLGILYLATLLKNAGVEVGVLDGLKPYRKKTIPLPKEFAYLKSIYSEKEIGPLKLFGAYYRFGWSDDEILDYIAKFQPDYIGITANFTAYFNTVAGLAEKIKQTYPFVKLVIGGYHATVYQKEIESRYPWFDHIISGADENEFLRVLGLPESPQNCFADLMADRSFISADLYQMHKQNFSFIVATRGCPRQCSFCTVASMHGTRFVKRSPEAVVAEMNMLYTDYQVRVFDFEDDNLTLDKAWINTLLDNIIHSFPQSDIRLYAMNGLSAETLTPALLEKLWLSGFRQLNISLVTAQDAMQRKLGRPFNNEQFQQAVQAALAIGFDITAYLIVGLPGQTYAEVMETIDYMSRLGVLVTPSIYYPPPGTSDFDELITKGMIDPANWLSFRSSALPVETDHFKRADLAYIFQYIRLLNFSAELKQKYQLKEITLEVLDFLSPQTLVDQDLSRAGEEAIGIAQLREFLVTGRIMRVYRV